MEKLKVFTQYQLRKLGGGFNFEDKKLVAEDIRIPQSIADLFNKPIDEVVAFNKMQRKENERTKRRADEGLRPFSSCIYYVEDVEATAKLQKEISDKKKIESKTE